MHDNAIAAGNETSRDFSAPLGSTKEGCLRFTSGAAGVILQADPALDGLYRAHFERHIPDVQVREGEVRIRYRNFSLFNWLAYLRDPVAEITLNAAIPWQVEIAGGVSKLTADLRALSIKGLRIEGGASGVLVCLPKPAGTVTINAGGGASNVTYRRPGAVAVRVWVGSGVSNLTLDEHYYGAVGGELHWETPDYKQASDRYDIRVGGGASNLTIGTL